MIFRCYIDTNDSSMTEELIATKIEKCQFFQTPPFLCIEVSTIQGAFRTKEWLLKSSLPDIIKEKKGKEYWYEVGDEIINSFSCPTSISIYLDRESVYSRTTEGYDCFYGITFKVAKVKQKPFDFSDDDISIDPRFW